jgi:hypothetical protein
MYRIDGGITSNWGVLYVYRSEKTEYMLYVSFY